MDRSNEEDEFPSTQVENGVPERKELYCEILKYPTVGSFSDVIIENLTNEDIEIVNAEPEPKSSVNKKESTRKGKACALSKKLPENGKAKTVSGYAFFVQHNKSELDKTDKNLKLNMKEINKKWKELAEESREIFNKAAKESKLSESNSKAIAEVEPKIKKKIKKAPTKRKKTVKEEEILTNVKFVKEFEDVQEKITQLEERNKRLVKLISETKLSFMQKSHELQLKNDNEAQYKIRYQRLYHLHEKCHL